VAQQATGRQRKKATEGERLTEDKIAEVAAAVRGALKKAARERTTTSWSRLRRQLGSALPHQLRPDDQIEILAQVDAGTPADEPLLMAVLAAGDTSSPVPYQRAAGRLGRGMCPATLRWRARSGRLTSSASTSCTGTSEGLPLGRRAATRLSSYTRSGRLLIHGPA